MFGIMLL